jgi:rhodanese-related sulfurtransferase
MKLLQSMLLVVIALFLAACQAAATSQPAAEVVGQTVTVEGGSYTDVSVAELQTMLANKDFTFINVHIPFEGDIADTDLSIPYDQIDQNLGSSPTKQDRLYCRSGRMSAIAAQTLISLGYTTSGSVGRDGGEPTCRLTVNATNLQPRDVAWN